MNKKMKIIFTVSIVLNVFLLAMAGGAAYRHASSPPWKQVREDLAPETRHMMARVFQKNHKELSPVLQQARAQKQSLIKILTAETFNLAQFEAGAKKLQNSQSKIQKAKILSMGALAENLSLEERKKLSVLFEKSLREKRGRGPHGKHKGEHKPPEAFDAPIPEHRPE